MPEFSFIGNHELTTDSNPGNYTFSGVSLGVADAGRYIVVAFSSGFDDTTWSCTIGGVSATSIIRVKPASGQTEGIFIALVPTGTTGDIVLTSDFGASAYCGISIWRLVGYEPTAYDTLGAATGAVADPNPSGTIDIPEDGALIAYMGTDNRTASTAIDWTGATEAFEATIEGGAEHSGAGNSGLAEEVGRTVSVLFDTSGAGSARVGMAVASFIPLAVAPSGIFRRRLLAPTY